MKNLRKLFGIIFVTAIIVCTLLTCELIPDEPPPNQPQNQTPAVGDYDIGNMTQPAGSVIAVTITPKSGKSTGAIKIYYAGTGSTAYDKSEMVPAAGTSGSTYTVTFDVAAASGWNPATGLSAGTLTIGTPTPVAGDFIFTNMKQSLGNVTDVVITPKDGKSKGSITRYYAGTDGTAYDKSQTLPTATGKYAVTFDVAAAAGWNPATGLSAGTLEINSKQTPKENDYDITIKNLNQTAGSGITDAATVTKKSGSDGEYKIYYEGVSPTTYAKNSALPTAAGNYTVTLEVAETTDWNPATFLVGTLIIASTNQTQTISATITGTPGIGNRLGVDIQKNVVGEVTCQWTVNGKDTGVTGLYYWPSPKDSGQKISVIAKCGTVTSAPATAVTIPSFTYTAYIHVDSYENTLYAMAMINGELWLATKEEGFTVRWLRNGVAISGAISDFYHLEPGDAGATITAEIKGFTQTKTSGGVSIPSGPIIPPEITIEWNDFSGRPNSVVEAAAREIEEAYKANIEGCATEINKIGNWCIDFYKDEEDRCAKIVEGKLHIHFSLDYYDTFNQHDKAERLDEIGAELKLLTCDAETVVKYSGNFEDIRMAKLTKPVMPSA